MHDAWSVSNPHMVLCCYFCGCLCVGVVGGAARIAISNGLSGYIPNDTAYKQVSYEITATHLKPGCADVGMVNGLVNMMNHH